MIGDTHLEYLVSELESQLDSNALALPRNFPLMSDLRKLPAEERDYRILATLDELPHLSEICELGIAIGERLPMSSFGSVGVGVQIAPTLREGLALIHRFHQLVSTIVGFELFEEADEASFVIDVKFPSDRGGSILIAMVAACLNQYISRFTGKVGNFTGIELMHSPSDIEKIYSTHFSITPIEHSLRNVFYFERGLLNLPSVMADELSYAAIVKQCEREQSLAGKEKDLVALAENAINAMIAEPPSLAQMASKAGVSERQLRYALSIRSTSYRQLVQQCRFAHARALLKNPDLTIAEIGYRLGYTDPANFSTAFKNWSGESPQQARTAGIVRLNVPD
ncbi:MAG: helix-turn-helix domain-containing protein [Sphingomonadaceae bacterium]|nr:helix-turn-helix domain-containing protein [Sphingomonadaceae bacterium]